MMTPYLNFNKQETNECFVDYAEKADLSAKNERVGKSTSTRRSLGQRIEPRGGS